MSKIDDFYEEYDANINIKNYDYDKLLKYLYTVWYFICVNMCMSIIYLDTNMIIFRNGMSDNVYSLGRAFVFSRAVFVILAFVISYVVIKKSEKISSRISFCFYIILCIGVSAYATQYWYDICVPKNNNNPYDMVNYKNYHDYQVQNYKTMKYTPKIAEKTPFYSTREGGKDVDLYFIDDMILIKYKDIIGIEFIVDTEIFNKEDVMIDNKVVFYSNELGMNCVLDTVYTANPDIGMNVYTNKYAQGLYFFIEGENTFYSVDMGPFSLDPNERYYLEYASSEQNSLFKSMFYKYYSKDIFKQLSSDQINKEKASSEHISDDKKYEVEIYPSFVITASQTESFGVIDLVPATYAPAETPTISVYFVALDGTLVLGKGSDIKPNTPIEVDILSGLKYCFEKYEEKEIDAIKVHINIHRGRDEYGLLRAGYIQCSNEIIITQEQYENLNWE